jgi:hypothetical protein
MPQAQDQKSALSAIVVCSLVGYYLRPHNLLSICTWISQYHAQDMKKPPEFQEVRIKFNS